MEKFKNYDGLLTEQGFITGIEMLSAYYMTFKFWQEDFEGQKEVRKRMWYGTFKNMSDVTFTKLIERYCTENIYAPQSPSSILEFAKVKLLEKQPKADSEFDYVIELNKKYSLYRNLDTCMTKIDNEITRKVTKALLRRFYNVGEDNREELRKDFVKRYNEYLKDDVQLQTNSLLGVKVNKLIE
jgi:hypothetical protein